MPLQLNRYANFTNNRQTCRTEECLNIKQTSCKDSLDAVNNIYADIFQITKILCSYF